MPPLIRSITGLILLLPALAAAEVTETLAWRNYTVRHAAGMELLTALNAASPIRENGELFHGYTEWKVDWRFDWRRDAEGTCRITGVRTTLNVTITLPAIETSDVATDAHFRTYLAALRTHELGHYALAQRAARGLDAEIGKLPPMEDCTTLERTANAVGYRWVEEANQRNRQYDGDTGHGRSQGAAITTTL